jgi:hypothetical protein
MARSDGPRRRDTKLLIPDGPASRVRTRPILCLPQTGTLTDQAHPPKGDPTTALTPRRRKHGPRPAAPPNAQRRGPPSARRYPRELDQLRKALLRACATVCSPVTTPYGPSHHPRSASAAGTRLAPRRNSAISLPPQPRHPRRACRDASLVHVEPRGLIEIGPIPDVGRAARDCG